MKLKPPACTLFDVHTHCGGMDLSNFYRGKYPTCQDILDLDAKRREAQVGYQVVFPMPTSIYYDIPRYWRDGTFQPSGYCEYPFQLENQRLLREIDSFGLTRQLPFLAISLQARQEEQIEAIYRWSRSYAVYGLKLHTKTDQSPSAALGDRGADFLQLARELDIPIMIHTSPDHDYNGERVLELAERFPGNRYCAAHFGSFSKAFFERLALWKGGNLFFDTAPARLLCAQYSVMQKREDLLRLEYEDPEAVLRWMAEHFGGFMLWSTDAPWYNARKLDSSGESAAFTYSGEAALPVRLGLTHRLAENTCRFLFGGTES